MHYGNILRHINNTHSCYKELVNSFSWSFGSWDRGPVSSVRFTLHLLGGLDGWNCARLQRSNSLDCISLQKFQLDLVVTVRGEMVLTNTRMGSAFVRRCFEVRSSDIHKTNPSLELLSILRKLVYTHTSLGAVCTPVDNTMPTHLDVTM